MLYLGDENFYQTFKDLQKLKKKKFEEMTSKLKKEKRMRQE